MPDWVKIFSQEIIKRHQKDTRIAAICGRIVSGKNFTQICQGYTGYAYVQGGQTRYMNYLNTACAAVYKDVFWLVGGFSENMRVNEDPDLALKLNEKGFRIFFSPLISVFHNQGIKSFGAFLLKQKRWGEILGLQFEMKYKHRFGKFLPLLLNPFSHLVLIIPIAFLSMLKIVFYNMKSDLKVILYAFFIFLGKIFFRWGIYWKTLNP